MNDYYIKRSDKLYKRLGKILKFIKPSIIKIFDNDFYDILVKEVEEEFKNVIPEIPYIGGKKNQFTFVIEINACIIAFYRVMKNHGHSIDEIVKILCEGTDRFFNKNPKFILKIAGRIFLSRIYLRRMKKHAKRSQKKVFQNNFIYTVEKGKKGEYNLKTVYSQCAACLYIKSQNAEELLPYCDFFDAYLSKYLALGLIYESRIGNGDQYCIGTFKKGRETIVPDHLKKFINFS